LLLFFTTSVNTFIESTIQSINKCFNQSVRVFLEGQVPTLVSNFAVILFSCSETPQPKLSPMTPCSQLWLFFAVLFFFTFKSARLLCHRFLFVQLQWTPAHQAHTCPLIPVMCCACLHITQLSFQKFILCIDFPQYWH